MDRSVRQSLLTRREKKRSSRDATIRKKRLDKSTWLQTFKDLAQNKRDCSCFLAEQVLRIISKPFIVHIWLFANPLATVLSISTSASRSNGFDRSEPGPLNRHIWPLIAKTTALVGSYSLVWSAVQWIFNRKSHVVENSLNWIFSKDHSNHNNLLTHKLLTTGLSNTRAVFSINKAGQTIT